MPKFAKEIYSFDLGRTVDRTTQNHNLGTFDVDFKKDSRCTWTYGFTHRTIEQARKSAKKLADELLVDTRIVNSLTGEVLE